LKKRDLEKKLKKLGATPNLTSKGSKHDKWIGINGYKFTVPRHNEINEKTASEILKQALKKVK
jgi:hypothetical protein